MLLCKNIVSLKETNVLQGAPDPDPRHGIICDLIICSGGNLGDPDPRLGINRLLGGKVYLPSLDSHLTPILTIVSDVGKQADEDIKDNE